MEGREMIEEVGGRLMDGGWVHGGWWMVDEWMGEWVDGG